MRGKRRETPYKRRNGRGMGKTTRKRSRAQFGLSWLTTGGILMTLLQVGKVNPNIKRGICRDCGADTVLTRRSLCVGGCALGKIKGAAEEAREEREGNV